MPRGRGGWSRSSAICPTSDETMREDSGGEHRCRAEGEWTGMSASGQHDPYGYQGEPAGGYAAQPAEREGSYGSPASDPYAVSGPYSASDPYAVQDSFSSPDPYSPHSSSAAQNPYAAPYAGPGHPPGGPSPWMQPPRQTSGMALAGFVVSLVSGRPGPVPDRDARHRRVGIDAPGGPWLRDRRAGAVHPGMPRSAGCDRLLRAGDRGRGAGCLSPSRCRP